MYCLSYFIIKNIIWQCLIKNHSVHISIIPLAKGKLSYTKELFVRQVIVFVSFRTFWKIQDKRYRQVFFTVLSHKSSQRNHQSPALLENTDCSQVFILWEICTLFPYFCIMFPCFCTVFTKNCTALSQSDSRNFSTYILKFYRKIHYLTREFHWLFTIVIVTWTYEDLFCFVTNALKKAVVF